jgi:peptide deformylase
MLKTLEDLLTLGNPKLYEVSNPIKKEELPMVNLWVADLNNIMEQIRAKYNFGRGIAAPQLGIMKSLVYINIDKPIILINPKIVYKSTETFEVWDDCMCFPTLFVKVVRHKSIKVEYLDINWQTQTIEATDGLSELLQHEIDHLNGILCTMLAIDNQSYKWRTL